MDGSVIACSDGSIVAGDRVYDPKPTVRIAFVERLRLDGGHTLWKRPLDLPPVALCHVASAPAVVVATPNGRLLVFRLST